MNRSARMPSSCGLFWGKKAFGATGRSHSGSGRTRISRHRSDPRPMRRLLKQKSRPAETPDRPPCLKPGSPMFALAQRVILAEAWRRRSDRLRRRRHRRPGFGSGRVFPGLFRPDDARRLAIDGSSGDSVWSSLRRAAGAGWWLGFGYFVAGLWWLGAAFLAEADRFAWALPLGVLGLPAVLAVFTAFGFVVRTSAVVVRAGADFCARGGPERGRMAARTVSHRVSLERFRNGSRRKPHSGPDRFDLGPLRPDDPVGPDFRLSRASGRAKAAERFRSRLAWRFWRASAAVRIVAVCRRRRAKSRASTFESCSRMFRSRIFAPIAAISCSTII